MKRYIEGVDREQSALFPERLEDWNGADNSVRAVDAFIEGLDLRAIGFAVAARRRRVGPPTILRCC